MSKKNQPKPAPKPAPRPAPAATPPAAPGSFLAKMAPLAVAALAFLLYANTLGHGYVLDDELALGKHPFVPKGFGGLGDILFKSYRENNFGGQLYRPLPLALFAIEWAFAPNNPALNHLMNVLWYALSGAAIFWMLREFWRGQNVLLPLAAAVLFVSHPIHTEVVANIKSRDEILCLLGCVLAFWQFARHLRTGQAGALAASAMAYFAALLSKEGAVTMLPVFPLLAWTLRERSVAASLRPSLVLLLPAAAYFLLRMAIFGGFTAATPDIMDNPIVAAEGFGQRLATGFAVLGKYCGLLVWPHPLSSDYSFTVIPLAAWSDLRAIFGLLVAVGLAGFAIWGLRRRDFLAFCAAGFGCAIALYTQILLVIGTLFGERLAYLPSLFFCTAVGFGLFKLLRADTQAAVSGLQNLDGKQTAALAATGAIALIFSLLTLNRNPAWHDNLRLFRTDSTTHPTSVRLHNGASSELYDLALSDSTLTKEEQQKLLAEAEAHIAASLAIRPTPTAYLNRGNIALFNKQHDAAIEQYRKSLEVFPNFALAKSNLALALRERGRMQGEKMGDPDGARQFLEQSVQQNPNDPETWALLGIAHGIKGAHAQAIENFEKAYALNPLPSYAANLAMAYANAGNAEKAAFYERKAKGQ